MDDIDGRFRHCGPRCRDDLEDEASGLRATLNATLNALQYRYDDLAVELRTLQQPIAANQDETARVHLQVQEFLDTKDEFLRDVLVYQQDLVELRAKLKRLQYKKLAVGDEYRGLKVELEALGG